jgi:IclR helix-turn-helix domain
MRIRRVKSQTPQSSPPSMADGGTSRSERFVWEVLVPRLLNPGVLSIIKALLRKGEPLPLREIAAAVDLSVDHARYHCQAMESRGILEVVQLLPRSEGEDDEPSYFFPAPPPADSSPSSTASATSA